MSTQVEDIFDWLSTGRTITSKQAFDTLGITRLSDVIFKLKKSHRITTTMINVPSRYGKTIVAQYKLIKEGVLF